MELMGLAVGITAVALMLLPWFTPMIWPSLPLWVAKCGFALGIALLLLAFYLFWIGYQKHKAEKESSASSPSVGIKTQGNVQLTMKNGGIVGFDTGIDSKGKTKISLWNFFIRKK